MGCVGSIVFGPIEDYVETEPTFEQLMVRGEVWVVTPTEIERLG